MKALLAAFLPLLASCGPSSEWLTQEEMTDLAQKAASIGYTCATFQIQEGNYVSDLWVGAPSTTPSGEIRCPGDHIVYYKGIDEEVMRDRELECTFKGFIRVSEWTCIRDVRTELSGLTENSD